MFIPFGTPPGSIHKEKAPTGEIVLIQIPLDAKGGEFLDYNY